MHERRLRVGGTLVLGTAAESDDVNLGFKAMTRRCEESVASGIIVPTRVDRVALEHAAASVVLPLAADSAIVEIGEKKQSTTDLGGSDVDDFDDRGRR